MIPYCELHFVKLWIHNRNVCPGIAVAPFISVGTRTLLEVHLSLLSSTNIKAQHNTCLGTKCSIKTLTSEQIFLEACPTIVGQPVHRAWRHSFFACILLHVKFFFLCAVSFWHVAFKMSFAPHLVHFFPSFYQKMSIPLIPSTEPLIRGFFHPWLLLLLPLCEEDGSVDFYSSNISSSAP